MSEAPVTGIEGQLLWEPSPARCAASRLRHFMGWLGRERGRSFDSYEELWSWSVVSLGDFWRAVARYFDVKLAGELEPALRGKMPDARWFPGASLNYAAHLLRRQDEHLAIVSRAEDGSRRTLSYRELGEQVARARAGLLRAGVKRGDRVAAVLPNGPEAVIGVLACASLGAVWSSAAPEFGVKSVLDRFQQIEPTVLLACDGYLYGGKRFDRTAELRSIAEALPGLRGLFVLGDAERVRRAGVVTAAPWSELVAEQGTLEFELVPFEHPLWILYSSGTTGLPKPIVQGHGGILLEHLKALALHMDLSESDRFFWFSTTGWMMWNMVVSGLAVGSTLVLYDGSPAVPGLSALWKLAEREQISYFGTSAPFLLACKKAGLVPKDAAKLGALRSIGTTGAPLPSDGFKWVYENVASDVLLGSVSGGTDVCTAFVLSCPLLPVKAGQIQCLGLGAKIESWDDAGRPLIGEVGELVLTEPLPSMPIGFWNDPERERFKASYFGMYPGVWRHGDWIKLNSDQSSVIYGRSDSTLNRGGVRMGTSEFYRVVEGLPEVVDSLVVDTGSLEDAVGRMWLFLVLREGVELDSALRRRIKEVLKTELSPRHVPDELRVIAAVPRTLNGKKLEVPVKRILLGADPEKVASRDTLVNPEALDALVSLVRSEAAPSRTEHGSRTPPRA
ncbi:MAG TPA: acetoacetate--CoA ligase [Polyangiaceae bacterium]|nr:acetoacetate--CoA ligase [Polyangiaceae bacterium]